MTNEELAERIAAIQPPKLEAPWSEPEHENGFRHGFNDAKAAVLRELAAAGGGAEVEGRGVAGLGEP